MSGYLGSVMDIVSIHDSGLIFFFFGGSIYSEMKKKTHKIVYKLTWRKKITIQVILAMNLDALFVLYDFTMGQNIHGVYIRFL